MGLRPLGERSINNGQDDCKSEVVCFPGGCSSHGKSTGQLVGMCQHHGLYVLTLCYSFYTMDNTVFLSASLIKYHDQKIESKLGDHGV